MGDEDKTDTWHLPWKFSSEEKTESHLRDALARFDQADIPASEKPAARAKLVRLCKEHGITVSDAKSGKALAKLIAEAEPGECGCSCLPCSKENNCQDCTVADCMDDDCEGCPAQAKAKAKQKKAQLAKKRAHAAKLAKRTPAQIAAGDGECGCTCLPCSKENNCQDCSNADCMDDDCNDGDCPMQAKASAKALAALETKLATANRTIDSLRGDLATAVTASTDGAAAAALNMSWLARISGDLEKGAELSASAVKDLPAERAAAESRIAQLGADLEAAQTALATEKAARLEESGAHAKFSERLSGELRQAGKLHGAAVEEMTDMARLAEARVTQLAAELEGAQSALAGEKKARVEENTAYVQWTGRLTGELSSAGKLYASSIEELSRRIAAAESRVAQTEAELETAQADLAAEKKARVDESTAHVEWSERLTGELANAGKLYASSMEELPQRIAAAEGRVTQIAAELETAQAALAAERKTRVEESTAYVQSTVRITAELSTAGALCAAAPQRIAAAEARVTEITAELETAQAALLAEKKARSEESTAYVQSTQRITTELSSAGKLHAAALEEVKELPKGIAAAEARVTQITAELETAQAALLAEKKARSDDAAANAQWTERLTADLKQAGISVDELPRRARAAEASRAQIATDLEATQTAIDAGKKTRSEEPARTQNTERLTADLSSASKTCVDAVEDLSRRARGAESRVTQIAAELTAIEAENSSGKKARSEDATRRTEEIAGLTAELSSAGKVCTDAVEELSRRARTAEAGASLITSELAGTQTAMEAGKKARGEETATLAVEIERLTADLTHAGNVYALAAQELPRRARASETAAVQITAELENVEAAIETREAGKKSRVKEKAERAERTERMTADLKQAGTLYAAAVQELPRRALAAEARVTQITAELESPKPAAEASKKARAADDANRVQGIERLTASLQQAGTLYASALEELHRRARFDEQRVTQITETRNSETRREEKKARAEEAEARAARTEEIERMTAELQQAATIYASASEEIARRARLAQL